MLTHLTIRHYALIESLDLALAPGFTVITGETGAGKSIILGALGLIQGQRADVSVIQQGESSCVVEGEFDITHYHLESFFERNDLDYSPHALVRRQLTANGKSRAFINDVPVNLTVMRDFASRVIDIHSQHANLLLQDAPFQMEVLDVFAGAEAELSAYQAAYATWESTDKRYRATLQAQEQLQADREFIEHQFRELEGAALREGEQAELEARQRMLAHAAQLAEAYTLGLTAIRGETEYNVLSQLRGAQQALERLASEVPATGALAKRLESSMLDLEDLGNELEQKLQTVDAEPESIAAVDSRLSQLYTLLSKHHCEDEKALIALRDRYREQLELATDERGALAQLEKEQQAAKRALGVAGQALHERRAQAVPALCKKLLEYLRSLGMPHAQFTVSLTAREAAGVYGLDQIEFLFSANANVPMLSLARIASGGEMSRVMLALKMIVSRRRALPTIVFDEIDTGISGEVASRMGGMLHEMAQQMQVINITHLPQIAVYADQHLLVYKEHGPGQTLSHIRGLDSTERVEEIAKLLSGASVTPAALANAQELLKSAHQGGRLEGQA